MRGAILCVSHCLRQPFAGTRSPKRTSRGGMKKPSRSFHRCFIPHTDSWVMAKNTTRALTLLAAVPATLGLAIGVGAGTASAQTVTSPAPAELGVVPYDGIFDDLHVPHHIRHQINIAAGSLGVTIPWHLLDGIDDDRDHDWDDHDDDWDDDRDDDWDDDWDD